MPPQDKFYEKRSGDQRIEVLKTYDRTYAREAFGCMDETAQRFLWESLAIDEVYEASDIPGIEDPNRVDFLWEELLEAAREDGNRLSFLWSTKRETAGCGACMFRLISPAQKRLQRAMLLSRNDLRAGHRSPAVRCRASMQLFSETHPRPRHLTRS
jgi:hypothetical protein